VSLLFFEVNFLGREVATCKRELSSEKSADFGFDFNSPGPNENLKILENISDLQFRFFKKNSRPDIGG
jgi:hypothetical protein